MSTSTNPAAISSRPFHAAAPGSPISFSVAGEPPTEMFVLAEGAQTGLRCTVAVYNFPAGTEGALHTHLLEDEGFFVLDGEITFLMPDDDVELTASAGEFVWHPCHRRHGYRVGESGPARVLQFLLPGSQIVPGFFARLRDEMNAGTLDLGEVARFSAEDYGTVFDDPNAQLPPRPLSTRGPLTPDARLVFPGDPSLEVVDSPNRKVVNAPFKSDASKRLDLRVGRGMMTDVSCVFHAFGHQTGEAFGMCEIHWGPGDVAGPHVHTLEDEGFYVLEGELTLHVSGPDGVVDVVARAGDFVWAPKDLPHYYEVTGENGAKVLVMLVPGTGIELFHDVSEGKGSDIETDEALARFGEWSAGRYGVHWLAPGEFPE